MRIPYLIRVYRVHYLSPYKLGLQTEVLII